MQLTDHELRVLGCLMEKQVTTPDQYPLTVNSLRLACNQTTNRWPIMTISDAQVEDACRTLREAGLTRIVYSTSNRAAKHRHVANEWFKLDDAQQAIMTVLILRGPQTVGELKGRTERMHAFGSLEAVERELSNLADRPEPLVARLARQPGQKEERFAHLLAPVDLEALAARASDSGTEATPRSALADRVSALEARVAELESIVERLRDLL